MKKKLTFVLMTCGELAEKKCVEAIKPHLHEVEFCEVRNVFPQIKALNQMIKKVRTDFFIPLDADIVLDRDAYPRIKNAINKNEHDPKWHSILFPLYDTLTDKRILALKILRTKVMKQNLFKQSTTPDVEHYQRLTGLGYSCIHDYLNQRTIGKHIVAGKHFCYHKFRDVYQTYRNYNFEWDSGVFLGGNDLRSHAKAHYNFFMKKWSKTGNKDYLHCIAGMMDGILSPVENKSKTLKSKKYNIKTKWAIHAFLDWYMAPLSTSKSGSMLF